MRKAATKVVILYIRTLQHVLNKATLMRMFVK